MQDLLLRAKDKIQNDSQAIEQIVSQCHACQLTTAIPTPSNPGARQRGTQPGTYWEVYFTEIKPEKNGYKYLSVFIDTFSG